MKRLVSSREIPCGVEEVSGKLRTTRIYGARQRKGGNLAFAGADSFDIRTYSLRCLDTSMTVGNRLMSGRNSSLIEELYHATKEGWEWFAFDSTPEFLEWAFKNFPS